MTGTLIPPWIRHALTIIGSLTLGAPAALAQCDLDAKFGGNASQTFLTGQPAGLSVRFTNLATSGDCAANQVRLRLTGGSLVTAPMVFQALPALPPKGVVVLTFQVTVPLPGTHVFEVEYATPHQDVDNGNHHPTRAVTFSAPAVTLAQPDLMVTSVGPVDVLRVGKCNTVNVTVRNTGSALQTATQLTLLVYGPAPGNALVDRHAIPVAAFAAGESRTIPVPAVSVPSAGAWRIEAMADATIAATEMSESNNTRRVTIDDVSRPCQP